MKRLVATVLLALAPALASAAPPTTAQIEALLEAMDARAGTAAVLAQMQATSQRMAESMLAPDADAKARAAMERALAASNETMRELMDWDRIEPAHRQAYAEVFTADEVEAMTRFYASPEGRAVLRKMPQVMDRIAQAMQPAMREAMERIERDLRRGAEPQASAERH